MTDRVQIAVDGQSSSGKSTIAKMLASRLGFLYIDTGAMYRSVTVYFMDHNVDIEDSFSVSEALAHIDIHFEIQDDKQFTYLNGLNVEGRIRELDVADRVSEVSTLKAVREALVKRQRDMSKSDSVVMDGRDIGTVVFPEAVLKLFIVADVDERSKRRYEELKSRGMGVDFNDIRDNLMKRDRIDSNRKISPLKRADDAIEIDTTHLSIPGQAEDAYQLAIERIKD